MRSSTAGALIMRVGLTQRQQEPKHDGSRVLKHLKMLVEIRCTAARPHELAHVYLLPGDVLRRLREQHLPITHGSLLFVSTDNERLTPGEYIEHETDPGALGPGPRPTTGRTVDLGDLGVLKARRKEAALLDDGRKVMALGVARQWTPLVDLLDFRPDDDAEHAVLETRCRCGERPAADRHALLELAREALQDGKTRRVFL